MNTHRQLISQQTLILRQSQSAQRARDKAIRERIIARHNPAPVLRSAFVLRAAIALGMGATGASGLGSILGYLVGSL